MATKKRCIFALCFRAGYLVVIGGLLFSLTGLQELKDKADRFVPIQAVVTQFRRTPHAGASGAYGVFWGHDSYYPNCSYSFEGRHYEGKPLFHQELPFSTRGERITVFVDCSKPERFVLSRPTVTSWQDIVYLAVLVLLLASVAEYAMHKSCTQRGRSG